MIEKRVYMKKESLETVKANEKVFLDFIDYLFPYLDVEIQVKILEKYKGWLNGE